MTRIPRLHAERQTDFSGGVNLVSEPYLLKRNQVYRIRNLLLQQHGGLDTRPGYSIVTTSPAGASAVIIARGYLNTSTGGFYPYAVINDSANTILYLTNTNPWTLIGSFVDANSNAVIPQMATMLDTEVFALGNFIVPSVFNGTTIVPITAGAGQTRPAGAAHAIYHLGALWLWNTSSNTTDLDGPSSLRQSDINNYNSWPNLFQTFVGKNDGQSGQGFASFTIAETGISPTQTLVLFKNFSSYQVTGTFGSSNFAVQKVKSDMGCIAPRTIQFVSGYGVMRLTHKGFAVFNGVEDQIISEQIRPLIFGDPTGIYGSPGPPIDFTKASLAYAAQAGTPPLYIAVVPIIGSNGQLQRHFIYDLIRKAWTVCDYPANLSWFGALFEQGQQPVVQGGTYENPVNIITMYGDDQTDAGNPIVWDFITKTYSLGNYMDNSVFRRGIISIATSTSTTVTVRTAYSNTATVQVNSVAVPITTGHQDVRVSWDMNRVSQSVYFLDVAGTGAVSIRGIEIQGTPRPLTKQVS